MKNLFGYFRECYYYDKSRGGLDNIFSDDIEHRYFLQEEELLNGLFPFITLEETYSKKTSLSLELFKKEKKLAYCSLFIAGSYLTPSGESKKVCAPLITINADLSIIDDQGQIELNPESISINDILLYTLSGDSPDAESTISTIYQQVGDLQLTSTKVNSIGVILQKIIPNLKALETINYPKLIDQKALKKVYQKSKELNLLPVSMVAMLKRSNEAVGILQELGQMAKTDNSSECLNQLFEGTSIPNPTSESKLNSLVPAVLSKAQEKALRAIENQPLTLLIGPPGTGKSYTISALAIEHVLKGKKVLISSKTDQAVDVIGYKIEEQLGLKHSVVRGGSKHYLRSLKTFVQDLLDNIIDIESDTPLEQLKREIEHLENKLTKAEERFQNRASQQLQWSKPFTDPSPGFFSKIHQQFNLFRHRHQGPLWKEYQSLETQLDEKLKVLKKYLIEYNKKRYRDTLEHHRKELLQFQKALKARTATRQDQFISAIDWTCFTQLFPLWLVKLSDLHRILPLEKELFDLVILDEASLCDISSCIPALYRAKKAVIAGDPKQLRHISFLSEAKLQSLYQKYHVTQQSDYNFRKNSILDLFNSRITDNSNVTFLDEHFRSQPDLIAFSNQKFYRNRLKVMTEKPSQKNIQSFHWTPCSGQRDDNGINSIEAEQLHLQLRTLLDQSPPKTSIGIISPFRKQTDYLTQIILDDLSLTRVKEHQISIGTPYAFQGEERDIMLISFGIDEHTHPAALRYLEREDVFNVMITRAKHHCYLFSSFNLETLPQSSLLKAYFESLQSSPSSISNQVSKEKDPWTLDLLSQLDRLNLSYQSPCPIAGQLIDIVITHSKKSLGIDLIGFPGDFEDVYPLERYKMFKRAGLKMIPLSFLSWKSDPERCLNKIKKHLN